MRAVQIAFLVPFLACGPGSAPGVGVTTGTTFIVSSTDDPPPTSGSTPVTSTQVSTTEETLPSTTIDPISDLGVAVNDVGSSSECNPYIQDCKEGEKCVPVAPRGSFSGLKCVPVIGEVEIGGVCTSPTAGVDGVDDCSRGSVCWYVDADKHGVCIAQCTGQPGNGACASGFVCVESESYVVTICLFGCSPLVQDCFSEDDVCVPAGEGFECMSDASGDQGQANDPCAGPNSCDEGLACLSPLSASNACDPNAEGCCQPFCQFPDANCPNPDQGCISWFDPVSNVPGYADLGICAVSF